MTSTGMTFAQFVKQFSWLFNGLIAVLAFGAVLIFFYGLARYMFIIQGNTKEIKNANTFMLWGILALFIILALGGILNFFAKDIFPSNPSFFKPGTTPSCIPTANGLGCAM